MLRKVFLIFILPLFLFSCEELNNVSEELKVLKENQDLLLKQQSDLIKQIASLQTAVKNQGSKAQPKKNSNRFGVKSNHTILWLDLTPHRLDLTPNNWNVKIRHEKMGKVEILHHK